MKEERKSYWDCSAVFKGRECCYEGPETICNKTLMRCRELDNLINFRGRARLPDERAISVHPGEADALLGPQSPLAEIKQLREALKTALYDLYPAAFAPEFREQVNRLLGDESPWKDPIFIGATKCF